MEVIKLPILGQVINRIIIGEDKSFILFFMVNGDLWQMYHEQDCCEEVAIDDIEGDLQKLRNFHLTQAEKVTERGLEPEGDEREEGTWTFYKFATGKEYVTIKWFGLSNGYYSEEVSFVYLGNLENENHLKKEHYDIEKDNQKVIWRFDS